jgi:NodT family efflux transporter outer membrane factor (OMF) lipoprotein
MIGPFRLAFLLVLMTMPAGCTVGPDFRVPDGPPVADYLPKGAPRIPGQSIARGADIPGRWWDLFRSAHLSRLVEQGLAQNADLRAAEAALRAAQENALAQQGALFPQLAGNMNSTRQKTPTATLTSNATTGAAVYTVHTAQATVAFVPDVFGGTRRQIEAAEAAAENQAFQREAIYLTLTANIALAAIQEASLRGQIQATRRAIDVQTQLLTIMKRQQAAGQIALPDVVAQETAVAQAQLLLPPLERQLAQQRHLLAVLCGRFPSEETAATFRIASFRLPREVPLSVPANLVRQRPDIRASEADVRAANAQVGVAIANRLPQITLTGGAGGAADALSRLFAPGTGLWLIAGNALQPIFDGGTLRHKQSAAEEELARSVAQYRSTVLAAFQNVADVLSALQADARALSAATAAEQSAQRNIDLVRRQVEQGQVSIPNLLIAQQAYLQTSVARVQAEAARLADTVALFQALGGGWWNRQEAVVAVDQEPRQ